MAIAKTKPKTVQKDMAQAHVCTCQPSPIHKHLFLGGAITLLLVLATAQFALSRITWGEVRALRQGPEQVTAPVSSMKEATYTFYTEDFSVVLPASFNVMTEEKEEYTVYEIEDARSWNSVRLYLSAYEAQEKASLVQTGGGNILRETKYVGPEGRAFAIEYWSEEGVSAERLDQLRYAVEAIEWRVYAEQGGYLESNQ